MKRRTFLLGSLASTAVLGGTSLSIFASDADDSIIGLIRDAFPGLDMPEQDLAQFAHAARHNLDGEGALSRWVVQNSSARTLIDRMTERDVNWIPSRIITDFIRSTNFADPDRGDQPTAYVAYADPYAVGCSNPLPFYSDSAFAWPSS